MQTFPRQPNAPLFDRLKALLGEGERMLAAFWAGTPPTLRAVNRFNRKIWRSANRQAFGLSLADWDRFKTPLEDQMPMLMSRAELQDAGLLRRFADDRNGVIAFERLYTLVQRLKELLSAITERDVTPSTFPPTVIGAEQFNPLIVALEELDAIYVEGDHMATLFQCEGAKLPTFDEAAAWNQKAIESAKRKIFSQHISAQDWARFKEDWNFADCQRLERILREHRCLDNATAAQCSTLRFLWGRVKRLGELIGKIKGIAPRDENETPVESLTNFLLKTHSLLDASANLGRLLPQAERHDLIASIRQFLRDIAPEYVARFNEIVEAPPARIMEFPPDFTEEDKEEWTRTRREPCDQLHAIAAYLTRVISDVRSKLPS
jgi:hypothetical protein